MFCSRNNLFLVFFLVFFCFFSAITQSFLASMAYPLYLGALLCLAVIFTVKRLASYLSAYRFKKAHGCKPVRRLPQSERILGWAYFRRQMKAVKEKRILEEMRSIYDSHGPTFSSVVLGGHLINTIDPENIKTILASSFADFGLGGRLKAFGPLLGNGIFTSDGAAWEHSRVRNVTLNHGLKGRT